MRLPTTIKRFALISLLVAIVALPLGCLFTFLYVFYLHPDPVSPPSTELGAEPRFDHQLDELADESTLLFREDNRIVLTDGYGHNPRVFLDLSDTSNDTESHTLGHETISPSGLRLAVNHYWGQPAGEVIVVDIQDGSILNLPIPAGDYQHDWSAGAYWLTDDLFLVKTHRFPGEDMFSEQERFLLFDATNTSPRATFDFPPCPMFAVLSEASQSLLVASDCVPLDKREVWAIDSDGKRQATAAEVALFDERSLHRYDPFFTYQHPSIAFPLITIEHVWEGAEGFGRFYEHNWNRDGLYLGDSLVRVSDVFISYDPDWQAGLQLFIWTEGDQTYIMDNQGHYRKLYHGAYLGRVPRN